MLLCHAGCVKSELLHWYSFEGNGGMVRALSEDKLVHGKVK